MNNMRTVRYILNKLYLELLKKHNREEVNFGTTVEDVGS